MTHIAQSVSMTLSEGEAQETASKRVKTVNNTLSDARCSYETSPRVIINRVAIEAVLLTCFDPTTLDPIDIY
jgi:hypothetical protein